VESLRAGWRTCRQASGAERVARLGLLGAVGGILTDALVSTSPHFPETQINFWLLLVFFGASERAERAAPEDAEPIARSQIVVRSLLALGAVALVALAIFHGLLPECDLTRGIAAKSGAIDVLKAPLRGAKPDTARAAALLNDAIERLTLAHVNTYEPEVFIYSGEHLAPIHEYYRGELVETVGLYEQIDRLCSGFGETDRKLASVYVEQHEPRKAAEQLLKYLRKNRFAPDAYEQLYDLAEEHQYRDMASDALPLLNYAIPRIAWDHDRDLRLRQICVRFQRLVLQEGGEEGGPALGPLLPPAE
jgi:hypothetical protein